MSTNQTSCCEDSPLLSGPPLESVRLEYGGRLLQPDGDVCQTCVLSRSSTRLTTPLPKLQLFILCLVRIVDPLSYTQIFPYINEMMQELLNLGDNPSQIGFFSGLVESIFSLSQLFVIYHWAKISDSIGRKPVIVVGLIGVAFSTLAFGLTSSLTTILVARAAAGIFSGNLAVIQSVLGELTDETNQNIALPLYGLCWPFGSIIGPLLGGGLIHPTTKYPKLAEYIPLLTSYPYFLPCLLSSLIALAGAGLAWRHLEETLPSKRNASLKYLFDSKFSSGSVTSPSASTLLQPRISSSEQIYLPKNMAANKYRSDRRSCAVCSLSSLQTPSRRLGIQALLSMPSIQMLCTYGFALSFLETAFAVVFVLFCFSPVSSGGLAFSPVEIGYALAIAGLSTTSLQIFLIPILLRNASYAKCAYIQMFCLRLWPLTFMMMPGLNLVARLGDGETIRTVLWTGIAVTLLLSKVAGAGYPISIVLTKMVSPSPEALGASNGVVQFAMCLARTISPAFVSILFGASTTTTILGGHTWVVVMVGLSVLPFTFLPRHGRKFDVFQESVDH